MSATTVRPPAFLPRTFLEWGIAVPFTTPMLCSGRIRPGRRGKAEVLLPNPSGGRGLYVIDLGATPEVTSLTLHDRLLVERLLELAAPTPSEIRKAARQLALDGAAGRRASREADAAATADATVGLMIQLHLVTRLLQEAGLQAIDWRRFTGDNRELRATIRSQLNRSFTPKCKRKRNPNPIRIGISSVRRPAISGATPFPSPSSTLGPLTRLASWPIMLS